MRRKLFFVLLICSTTLVFSGCHLLWKHYHSKNNGFSIALPRWWQADNTRPPAALAIMAPLQGKNDAYRENLTVTVADLNNQDEKELFWETNKKIILREIPGYKSNIQEGEIFAGILKGQWLSFEVQDKQIHLRIKTAVWFKGLRVYVLTYSTEAKNWDKYSHTFDKILASFRY